MRFAVINNQTVENIILADSAPTIAGRLAVLLSAGQAVSPGDSYDGVNFTARVPDAAELERRDALRQVLPILAAWADDAQDVAALTAMTAGQRLTRQAVIEGRFAALSKILRRLLIVQGMDQ